MSARLLSLGALVLVAAGCGAEEVPAERAAPPTSVRIESVMRVTTEEESEVRSSQIVDFNHGRRLDEDKRTGCRSVTIGDDYYVEQPEGYELPEGKRWVRYDRDQLSDPDSEAVFERTVAEDEAQSTENVSVASLLVFEEEEPLPGRYLDDLRQRGTEVRLVANEELRGERTTHYRATVDDRRETRRELEAAGWKPANVERYLDQFPAGETEVDVWVGSDRLERRVVTTTRYADTSFPGEEVVMTADYVDYGLEPKIEAPPEAEVVGADEFMRLVEERMQKQVGEAPRPSEPPSCLH